MFSLPATQVITLDLFDIEEKRVTSLFSGTAGPDMISVDLNTNKVPLASGMYVLKCTGHTVNATMQVMIIVTPDADGNNGYGNYGKGADPFYTDLTVDIRKYVESHYKADVASGAIDTSRVHQLKAYKLHSNETDIAWTDTRDFDKYLGTLKIRHTYDFTSYSEGGHTFSYCNAVFQNYSDEIFK